MTTFSTLGSLLAAVRKQRGLTQVALCKHFTYPYNIVSKWENGHAKPTRQEYKKLVEVLGPDLPAGATAALLEHGLAKEEGDKEPESRPSHIEEGITKRLKHLRTSAGYTACFVAEQIGMHASQYTRLEQGASNPTYQQLRGFAALYNKSYEYLLDGDTNHLASPPYQQVVRERDLAVKEATKLRKVLHEMTNDEA